MAWFFDVLMCSFMFTLLIDFSGFSVAVVRCKCRIHFHRSPEPDVVQWPAGTLSGTEHPNESGTKFYGVAMALSDNWLRGREW